MSTDAALLFDALGGATCGLLFFGGLWWTVRCGLRSTQPALWFLTSLLVRSGVVVLGLVWIGHHDWTRMLAALLGLLGMRYVVRRVIGAPLSRVPRSGAAPARQGAVP